MKKTRDPNRQVRYEAFLDSVHKREEAAIVSSIPTALEQMARIINRLKPIMEAKVDTLPVSPQSGTTGRQRWEATLSTLRQLYATVRTDTLDPMHRLEALQSMAHTLSSWSRATGITITIYKEYVNDSFKYDPKANRIASLKVITETR
jgi:hypothetical protein